MIGGRWQLLSLATLPTHRRTCADFSDPLRTFVCVGTGLIYAAIVAAWAAYLVPLWLRRQDEAIAARDEGSTVRGRVLRRRTESTAPADLPTDARAETEPEEDVPNADAEEFEPVGRQQPTSAARRRRTLLVLLLATTGTAAVAAFGYAPWWTVAIPGGLVVTFILISAVAAGHERRRYAEHVAATRTMRAAPEAEQRPATETATAEPKSDDHPEPTPRRKRDDGLWDPVSVPLPTYVTKAKAPRTVRTISLSDSDTWSSGRLPDAEPEPADRADHRAPGANPDAATGTDDATARSR